MINKLKATAVSYLNTKPLLFGLVQAGMNKSLDLELNIPSECARKLAAGEVDLGLVPVAVIPELPRAYIVSDFCIGAVGAVDTVCIYSQRPIESLKEIYLDFHSRTSVALAQLLIKEYWQLQPKFLSSSEGYIDKITGTTGGVVIGDRTIGLDKRFEYVYDLGEVWQQHTGLPFVFAAWVSTRPLPTDFIRQFNEALQLGVEQIPTLMYLLPSPQPDFDLEAYFTKYISYHLDDNKKKGLKRFLNALDKTAIDKLHFAPTLSPSTDEVL